LIFPFLTGRFLWMRPPLDVWAVWAGWAGWTVWAGCAGVYWTVFSGFGTAGAGV